jgi:hypothetical protein
MAKIIKIIKPITLVDVKLLCNLSKEVTMDKAVEAVSSPDPFNVEFKDAETIIGIIGATA